MQLTHTKSLGWILSSFFIKKAFSEDAKDFGDHIVSDIKEQFIEKLHAAEWMSREIRKLGVEKGRPISFLDTTEDGAYY